MLDKQDLQCDIIIFMLENPRSQQEDLMGPLLQHLGFKVPVVTMNKDLQVKPLSLSCCYRNKVPVCCKDGLELFHEMSSAMPNVASSAVSSDQFERLKEVGGSCLQIPKVC